MIAHLTAHSHLLAFGLAFFAIVTCLGLVVDLVERQNHLKPDCRCHTPKRDRS